MYPNRSDSAQSRELVEGQTRAEHRGSKVRTSRCLIEGPLLARMSLARWCPAHPHPLAPSSATYLQVQPEHWAPWDQQSCTRCYRGCKCFPLKADRNCGGSMCHMVPVTLLNSAVVRESCGWSPCQGLSIGMILLPMVCSAASGGIWGTHN